MAWEPSDDTGVTSVSAKLEFQLVVLPLWLQRRLPLEERRRDEAPSQLLEDAVFCFYFSLYSPDKSLRKLIEGWAIEKDQQDNQ